MVDEVHKIDGYNVVASFKPLVGAHRLQAYVGGGILGLCRIHEKPAVYNGEIAIRSMMTVSLTWDHRVVDGAPASEFLQALCRFLEEPTLIMT